MIPEDYWEKIPKWNRNNPSKSFEILSDPLSGRIPVTRLERWQDFSEILENHYFNRPNVELVFRGHRRHDWGMVPSLGRVTSDGIVTEDLASEQLSIFRKAIRGRIDDHSLLVNDSEDDELWSIGQHHGLMTPLLDWTYSPYVALFFAFAKEDRTDEKENPYRAVFILNKTFIESISDSDLRIFEPRKDDHGRLVSQAGLFTFSPYDATIENKLTDILGGDTIQDDELRDAAEEDQAGILAKYICKVYIKNEEQQDCVKHLRRMNVHHASLFPDLLGAADYSNISISERVRERQISAKPSVVELTAKPADTQPTVGSPVLIVIRSIHDLLRASSTGHSVEPGRMEIIAQELGKVLAGVQDIVDWKKRDSLCDEVRAKTRIILRKYGYPEQFRDSVVNKIIELGEDAS